MKIILSWPAKELSPNARVHWAKKKKFYDAAKDEAFLKTPNIQSFGPNIPLEIIFYPPDGRQRDLDNCLASIKAHLDGVALKLGVNDKIFRPITIDFGLITLGGQIIIYFK